MKITKIALTFAAIAAIAIAENSFAGQEFNEDFEQQGYLEVIVSRAQELGQKAISPFQAGYGYTDEEKATAKRMIKELKKQKDEAQSDYEVARNKIIDPVKRNALKEDYKAMLTTLDDQIYQQQLIIGKKWSMQRKLLWAAVGVGSFALGVMLVNQYVNAALARAEISARERIVLAIELKSLQQELHKVQENAEKHHMAVVYDNNIKQAEVTCAKAIHETTKNSYWDCFWSIITGAEDEIEARLKIIDLNIQKSQEGIDHMEKIVGMIAVENKKAEMIIEEQLENLVNGRPLN